MSEQTAKRTDFPLDLYKSEIHKVHFNAVWGRGGGNRSKDKGALTS